ncbi:MAG: TetR/AcrR family transcriptional regulator [Proteobacteria bacterium]|nr:TetR/AcrR family transcriptional regulator [Pseudomonadota bacterium]
MRRSNAQLQSDRRAAILDAAQRCFSRDGFHQTSVQQLCLEAGMSAGNLYRYFPSKEAIIAGFVERNRAEAAQDFATVGEAASFFEGLGAIAQRYLIERPEEEVGLCAEIMAESRRNPEIARLYQQLERDVHALIVDMLRRAAERGEIARDVDLDAAATMLMVLADGMSWRRAASPGFDAKAVLPHLMHMVHSLLVHPPDGLHPPDGETRRAETAA